ncbi:sulfite exporter TauE/SafE family protein [Chitinophagaceae bacterium LB-8]|uniref:Probable membrane transporter protein n=1 Tax=Paraflavisolibacter caeni TaxID=2982496 RepID=A0A9X3BHX0_9BACT|nr:sulfite exporter TauE/SafE family protein [Paraflavisolibacter caeni]MCU7549308.1 sulfite exporter TauE/SafE family protein [Paraflavisolibacter caeni]
MTALLFTLILLGVSTIAGLLGSLTGLGGGVVLIPVLTLIFKVDIHYAIGTSLISVIATSSGAAAAYVKEGISNIRLGMFLELATTIGAISGAFLATYIPTSTIAIIFGVILILSAVMSLIKHSDHLVTGRGGYLARKLKLNNRYPTQDGEQQYTVKNIVGGFLMMNVAGIISGLLGIGSGALKVIAMDHIMQVPFKVSTTTSNFMIGVTAVASAGIYLKRGYIDPGLSMPVVIGVLVGAIVGSKILFAARTKALKIIFAIVILILSMEMMYNGLTHKV